MDPLLSDDSDGESEIKEWDYSGKSGFVYVIDAREPMFQGGRESYFMKSIECCYQAMLQIAREQRYDMVSIVLFGANKTEGKFAPHGLVLLQPLLTPTTYNLKKIKEIIDGHCEDMISKYGHGQNVSLDKTLNYCKNHLLHCKTKLYNKSIVLFTFDDNPHRNDMVAAHRARKRAEEICLHQIQFDVVGLGPFDSSSFYKELVLTTRGALLKDWADKDPIKNIDDVQSEIASISKTFNKRIGMFYLGDEAKIRVIFYKLYHEPQKLIWVSNKSKNLNDNSEENEITGNSGVDAKDVEGRKNEEMQNNPVNIYEQETQELIENGNSNKKEEINIKMSENEGDGYKKREKYPNIGGKFIPISKRELQWFEAKVPKGLSLIGFRPLSDIPKHCVLGEPYFIAPDSRDKAGEKFFSTLLHGCLKEGVAPVCWFSLTVSSNPSLTVMYPTEPTKYAKDKTHQHGFHLIKIPFSDMITEPTLEDLPQAESSEIQIEAADGIVKKTAMNWYPDTFHDYAYKSRIAMIEAISMEYNDAEEIIDDTDIDIDSIAERLGSISEAFMDCSHLPAEALGKRGGNSQGGSKAKEVKFEDTTSLISIIKAGGVNKLTVAQLRELLRGEGIKSLSALNKPRLVALAEERFGSM